MRSRKVLFGSVFVLVLLLMMPCISAVQQNIIEEEIKNEISEKIESISFKDLEKLECIRHPILYLVVYLIYDFYILRSGILYFLSVEIDDSGWMPQYIIINQELYERHLWLESIAREWKEFWMNISEKYNWGWEIY